jgi:hypothetical protein
VSFVCSRISEQPTVFIFWVTKLIPVDAQVRQVTNIHCIGRFEGIWLITATVGATVDGACVKLWELRIPRTALSGPQQIGEVKTAQNLGGEGGIKYTYCMWVLVLRDSRAVRLFCSREHLAAQIPSNCTT